MDLSETWRIMVTLEEFVLMNYESSDEEDREPSDDEDGEVTLSMRRHQHLKKIIGSQNH